MERVASAVGERSPVQYVDAVLSGQSSGHGARDPSVVVMADCQATLTEPAVGPSTKPGFARLPILGSSVYTFRNAIRYTALL